MYYKVVIEAGQMRAEDTFQITRFVEAENSVSLFEMLEETPGLMTEELGYAVTMVKAVSQKEFEAGLIAEESELNRLRVHVRFKIKKACLITSRAGLSLHGETIDISAGGAGVSCLGELIPKGEKVELTIEELQLNNKAAEIVWTVSRPDINIWGLKWI